MPTVAAATVPADEADNGLEIYPFGYDGDELLNDGEDLDGNGNLGEDQVNGDGSSSDPLIIFAPSMVNSDDDVDQVAGIGLDTTGLTSTNGNAIDQEDQTWSATATGDLLVFVAAAATLDDAGEAETALGAECSFDYEDYGTSSEPVTLAAADEGVVICVIPRAEGSSGTGNVSIRVKNVSNTSTVETLSYDVYGPVKSLSFVKNFAALAEDATDSTFGRIVYKDAAGTDLLLAGLYVHDIQDFQAGLDFGADNSASDLDYDVNGEWWMEDDDHDGAAWLYDDFVADNSLEPGDNASVRVYLDTDDDDEFDSGELSVTTSVSITGPGTTGYIADITAADLAVRATNDAKTYYLGLSISLKDEDGRALGYLGDGTVWASFDGDSWSESYDVIDDATYDPSVYLDTDDIYVIDGRGYEDITVEDDETLTPDEGEDGFYIEAGDKYYYGWNEHSIVVDEVSADNTADAAGEGEFVIEYRTVSRIAAISKASRTVTASFGRATGGKLVTFLVERPNGTTVVRTAYANMLGKASITLPGTKTRNVTAFFGNIATETITVK